MCAARPTSLSPLADVLPMRVYGDGEGRGKGLVSLPFLPPSSLNLFNHRTRPPLSDTLSNDCAAAVLPSVPPVLTSPLLFVSHHQQLRRDLSADKCYPGLDLDSTATPTESEVRGDGCWLPSENDFTGLADGCASFGGRTTLVFLGAGWGGVEILQFQEISDWQSGGGRKPTEPK